MNLEIPSITNGVDKNDIQTPPHDSLPHDRYCAESAPTSQYGYNKSNVNVTINTQKNYVSPSPHSHLISKETRYHRPHNSTPRDIEYKNEVAKISASNRQLIDSSITPPSFTAAERTTYHHTNSTKLLTTTNTATTSSLLRPTSIAILTRLSKSLTFHVHTPPYANPSTSIIPITIIEEST